ncbi:hypothetical protein ALSL_1748 [Aerosticca soli]|uniref:Uncharacterized protein n=1 Tax=Aerosticca soli TaxID=2010829 RepID=A0A2Z6E5Y1_9GAMM|nr:hypothetical protein ALSL_1748 [Aerosticca soli]
MLLLVHGIPRDVGHRPGARPACRVAPMLGPAGVFLKATPLGSAIMKP